MVQLIAFRSDALDGFKNLAGVSGVDGFHEFGEHLAWHHAQQLADVRGFQSVGAGGNGLIEQRKGITQAAFGGLGHGA